MYKQNKYVPSDIKRGYIMEGESIETKVERIVSNKEPIKDGAPLIYTDRKEGVNSAYNIRTDRWEVATEAMDKVHKAKIAQREGKPENPVKEEPKVIAIKENGKAEPNSANESK